MPQSRADEILDVAETGFRRGGFDAISFRDIAESVGIKSASVHYHFPRKADLGQAVVARYTERFFEELGAPDNPNDRPRDRLARLTGGYRQALQRDGASCLCAVLGAVAGGLPREVTDEVAAFYERLITWTTIALSDAGRPIALPPTQIVAILQGAIVLAVSLDRPEILRETEDSLLLLVSPRP